MSLLVWWWFCCCRVVVLRCRRMSLGGIVVRWVIVCAVRVLCECLCCRHARAAVRVERGAVPIVGTFLGKGIDCVC